MTEKQSSNLGFVVIKNTCQVHGFTLMIYSRLGLDINKIKPSLLRKYELKSRNDKSLEHIGDLIDYDGKMAINLIGDVMEGYIYITKEGSMKTSIEIKLKFEVTDEFESAQDFKIFIEEIEQMYKNYGILDSFTIDQTRLHQFLRPHILGVRSELAKLNHVTEVSYYIEDNIVSIYGMTPNYLMEYAHNNQLLDTNKMKLNVNINKMKVSLFWDDDGEFWSVKGNQNVPQRGKMIIGQASHMIDKNKIHNNRKLNMMLKSLKKLRDNPDCKGRRVLHQVLSSYQENLPNYNRKSINLQKIFHDIKLLEELNRLNAEQKQCVEDILYTPALIVNGDGGTGKTEVGTLISLLFTYLEKRTIMTSEKNTALNNILGRIDQFLMEHPRPSGKPNIVRIKAKSHRINDENLKKYELERQIRNISLDVEQKCSITDSGDDDGELKKNFKRVFTDPSILKRLIAITYDIILITYGLLSEKHFLSKNIQDFDLNLIEASSSVNISQFSIAAHQAKQWIILNDKDQVPPLTVSNFLLQQPLTFPDKEEIQNAMEYNPSHERLKGAPILYGNKTYKEGVVSTLLEFEESPSLTVRKLKEQFRIHPKLHKIVCKAFKKKLGQNNLDFGNFQDLSQLSPLFSTVSHLKYLVMSDHEILVEMGRKIYEIVDSLPEDQDLTIGVACSNVTSLRKIVSNYRKLRFNEIISPWFVEKVYYDKKGKIKISFLSIYNHQEHEYDIFILGIMHYNSFDFHKRIYTALTRAHNYAIIFGPNIRSYSGATSHFLGRNRKILKILQEGGN